MTRSRLFSQSVEIATLCRPPRSRAARVVRENVDVPVAIREIDGAEAPVAMRIDVGAARSTAATGAHAYGRQGRVLVDVSMDVGGPGRPETGILEFRSSPDDVLCVGVGTTRAGPWHALQAIALAEIESGTAPIVGAYRGPATASRVEWSTWDAAARTLQRMADHLFMVEGRLFAPCDVPYVVLGAERWGSRVAPRVWSIDNTGLSPKTENAHLPLDEATRELPDLARCVEIVDAALLPGIGPSLVKGIAHGLNGPSVGETMAAARVLEAAGHGAPWPKPVDWAGLEVALGTMRALRSQSRIPNETCRIVLDLPEAALRPAPGWKPETVEESVFAL